MRNSYRTGSGRQAVTLIELLIVSGLLVVLASISLGAMKALLRGQKVSQAAVTVRQYLQNAQMRAVANGRPVAVFLDRVSMASDRSGPGIPTTTNYAVTRMQLGEVFPPYTGDVESVLGTLGEVDYSLPANADGSNFATSRILDAHADQVTFNLAEVAAGLSTNGFVNVGDLIEFDGHVGLFPIERIFINGALVSVHFFNPPVGYSNLRRLKAANTRHSVYESADHAAVAPQLPLSGNTIQSKFRIYRQPTRSLAGSIVLPRGSCIDLSMSGIGLLDSAPDGGTFNLTTAPDQGSTVGPSDFSRIALVFNSEGRLAYLLDENTMRAPNRIAVGCSSMLFLMVGRTEQVLPGFPSITTKLSTLQHPDFGASDLPKSNLLDPENVWVTCNPFTGEVKSSPVAGIDESDVTAKVTTVTATPTTPVSDLISAARALAASGMSN